MGKLNLINKWLKNFGWEETSTVQTLPPLDSDTVYQIDYMLTDKFHELFDSHHGIYVEDVI